MDRPPCRSEPDDLAARLVELRRQTDSLNDKRSTRNGKQVLDQRAGSAGTPGRTSDQRMVEQEQALLT
ncbi:hypothetical protein ACPA9J_27950 [Pseudomonas aeruginosa]